MEFTSFSFMLTVPLILCAYYVLPSKVRHIWLLAASCWMCGMFMPKALIYLLIVTVISYAVGQMLESFPSLAKKIALAAGIGLILLLMLGTRVFSGMISAVGISFYALSAISYLVDVYKCKMKAERNFIYYALYMAFFPKFLSGPIVRACDFLPQIKKRPAMPDYQMCKHASLMILWGYFEKVVIADHAALVVNVVFEKYSQQSGYILILGAVLFGIQLYADFAGYSYIAVGIAEFFGFRIINNFNRPYFAESISDFWHRWHISLSLWLRDYIYIPLGGNRKGKPRQWINLLATFMISGVWHGAGIKYLIWGTLHGMYQIIGRLAKPGRERIRILLNIKENSTFLRICRRIIVFLLVDFAWIFFRADSFREAIKYLYYMGKNLVPCQDINNKLGELGIEPVLLVTLLVGIVLLIIVESIQERKISIIVMMEKRNVFLRWASYVGLILWIMCAALQRYGMDASGFLYANF